MSSRLACPQCGSPAELEGWAFPSGGSFPVIGCGTCIEELDTVMVVDTRPINEPQGGDQDA